MDNVFLNVFGKNLVKQMELLNTQLNLECGS